MHTPSASSAHEMRILHDLSFLGHYLYVNTRTRSEEDRRQFIVSLTELGTKRALEEEVKRQAFLDEALACVNEAEQTALLATLDTLVAHWKTLEKSKKGEALCQQK